jgi:tetratricopeptide (TPR) repeat protein
VQRIAAARDRGAIFAADSYGGYLIWTLFPEHRPYLDTRLILRTPAEYSEYLRVVDEPSLFDAFQRRHGFRYVVLPTAYPERYLGLIAHLYRSSEWKLIYTDGTETLFAAREASSEPGWDLGLRSTTTRVLASIDREHSHAPELRAAARVQLATLELALAELSEAEHALSGVARPEAEALRARCLLARGDTQRAREISLNLLQDDGNDVQSLNLLAVLSLERGEAREALGLLRRALAIDPFDAEAGRILSSVEDQQHVESP